MRIQFYLCSHISSTQLNHCFKSSSGFGGSRCLWYLVYVWEVEMGCCVWANGRVDLGKEGTSRTTFCWGAVDTVTVHYFVLHLDMMAFCNTWAYLRGANNALIRYVLLMASLHLAEDSEFVWWVMHWEIFTLIILSLYFCFYNPLCSYQVDSETSIWDLMGTKYITITLWYCCLPWFGDLIWGWIFQFGSFESVGCIF